ncbi:uncharacterized protein LY79DRAFT_557726 [Colletotrichum navitas]|uniref:Uncharacterized protein n=1 Tax=Colletotrichum navitas TaxID=681940 RepID=A0AAD8PW09_9PEZI|nr:uncharacterized protein LY79DRAFT_557726 [Colletotrichum navitas]KAK1585754.1 hypothetical protein LY79DRAFT_557726 [Colletotrichum navitas]
MVPGRCACRVKSRYRGPGKGGCIEATGGGFRARSTGRWGKAVWNEIQLKEAENSASVTRPMLLQYSRAMTPNSTAISNVEFRDQPCAFLAWPQRRNIVNSKSLRKPCRFARESLNSRNLPKIGRWKKEPGRPLAAAHRPLTSPRHAGREYHMALCQPGREEKSRCCRLGKKDSTGHMLSEDP